jgi:hypothetical protein
VQNAGERMHWDIIQFDPIEQSAKTHGQKSICRDVCVTLCDIFIWCQPHMHPCSVIAGNGQKTAQTTWLEQSETQKLPLKDPAASGGAAKLEAPLQNGSKVWNTSLADPNNSTHQT